MHSKPLKFYRFITNLQATFKSAVWILSGEEPSTHERLKVLFTGDEKYKNYIAKIAFNETCQEFYVGNLYFWQLHPLLHKNSHECALAIIESNFLRRFLTDQRTFFIPTWLKTRTKLPMEIPGGNVKEDLRKIRKYKLDYSITTSPDHLYDYFYNMYLPTIEKRHGERALLHSYAHIMQKVKEGNCELLLIKMAGKSIAGKLILTHNKKPRAWSNGIRDGNTEYLKIGAIGATYYFTAQYLAQLGYKKLDMGLVRSFLNDGVLQYKKKWGAKMAAADSGGYLIKPLKMTNGAKGFLMNNPFAYVCNNRLYGAVFVDRTNPPSEEGIRQIKKDYYLNGFCDLNIFQFDEFLVKQNPWSFFRNFVAPLKTLPSIKER